MKKLSKRNKKLLTVPVVGLALAGVAYASWVVNTKDEVTINTGKLELTAKVKEPMVLVDHNPNDATQVEFANSLREYVTITSNITPEGSSTQIDGLVPTVDIVSTTQYKLNNKIPAKLQVDVYDSNGNIVDENSQFVDQFGNGINVWCGATLGENNMDYPILDVDTLTERLYDTYEEVSQEQWYLDLFDIPMEEWDFKYTNFEHLNSTNVMQIKMSIIRSLQEMGAVVDVDKGIIQPVTEPIYINQYFGYSINENDAVTNGGMNINDYGFTVKVNLVQATATDME